MSKQQCYDMPDFKNLAERKEYLEIQLRSVVKAEGGVFLIVKEHPQEIKI